MTLITLFTAAPVHLVQSKILAATLLLCVESDLFPASRDLNTDITRVNHKNEAWTATAS